MQKKKKIIWLVSILVITIILLIAFAYASLTDKLEIFMKSTAGSVKLDALNFQIQTDQSGTMGDSLDTWNPGDVNLFKWDTINKGTAAVYTRHTLQIYWNQDIPDTENHVLYLYPANMSKTKILEDFNSNESVYVINNNQLETITTDDGNKVGFSYTFEGDILDGTSMTGYSLEKNYNSSDFTTATDDNITTKDTIAFKLLFSPTTSYLYQDKTITIKIITEAMQYTTDGQKDWQVVDVQEIE